jgi:hypothetical protein
MANRALAVVRASQPVDVMTTELDALANDAAVLSAAIENGTELDLYADWELAVTFASAPSANGRIELWLVRTLNEADYEDAGAGPIVPQNGFLGAFVVRALTSAQRLILPHPPHILLPPKDFKVLVVNRSGQAFPASGSTLRALFYRESIA